MQVELRFGEDFNSLLKRFKQKIAKDDLLSVLCNRLRLGGKPSDLRKFKRANALARYRKRERVKGLA